MQKKGLKFYSLFATLLFVLPACLQLLKAIFGLNDMFSLITYALIIASFVYNYLDLKKREHFSQAFRYDNSFKLNLFAYLVAFGFFIEFISNIGKIVNCISKDGDIVLTYFVPLCMCCVFALLSCFYFVTVGISYGTRNYDFRFFKLFHIVILLWVISKLLTAFGQVIRFTSDSNGVIRYISVLVLACFFYFFVSEVENKEGASIYTLLFARMTAYCSGLYFLDRLCLVIVDKVPINSHNTYFALTMLCFCFFPLFFEKNIIHNSTR